MRKALQLSMPEGDGAVLALELAGLKLFDLNSERIG